MAPEAHDHEDDDLLDGCELDFAAAAVDDETGELLALFPDGVADPERERAWIELGEFLADGGAL